MKRWTWGIMPAVLAFSVTAYPALADSHGGSSGWTQKEQKLATDVADTLNTFVPKVSSVESALATQLGANAGTTVTSSVYLLPPSVETEIGTIQADASQLQSIAPPQLLKELQTLQSLIERTRENLHKSARNSAGSSRKQANRLSKLQSAYSLFQQDVSDLQTAYAALQATPASHTDYDTAKRAWKHVLHEGKKIEEWAREWSSGKGGN